MQLVKIRPLRVPVYRRGVWADDFSVTGAANQGYTTTTATITKQAGYIALSATAGATYAQLFPPSVACHPDVVIETRAKRLTGAFDVVFRRLDVANYIRLQVTSGNNITLTKYVLGASTQLASVSGLSSATFRTYGIRAIGPNIEIFFDGRRIISVSEEDNIDCTGIYLASYDVAAGTANAHIEYLYISPR